MTCKKLVNVLLAGTLALGGMAVPATAQWAVFDGANYAQNVLEAARALQQINNQIQSLQNEATMLTNMATNLKSLNVSSLSSIVTDLTQISTLMSKAQGISFNVAASQAAFAQTYRKTTPHRPRAARWPLMRSSAGRTRWPRFAKR